MSSDLRFDPAEMRRRGYDPTIVAVAERAVEARAAAAKLITQIEAAFGDISRPKITRSVAGALDDEWDVPEARRLELTARDPEQHWRDVTHEMMQNHGGYFIFADPEGCRFYLPAVLRLHLRDFPYSGYDVHLTSALRPEKLTQLTAAEMECVRAYEELRREFPDHDFGGLPS